MKLLNRRVRIERAGISDEGRRHAGREGRIQKFERESTPPGAMAPGAMRSYTVRLDDGEMITVRPEEVRFL